MKKQLFTGFSLMAVAGMAFWACGEGTINKMDEGDDKVSYMYPDGNQFKTDLVNKCKNIPECMDQFGDYINGDYQPPEPEVSSSSEEMPISHGTVYSSQREIDIGDVPSSSSFVFKEPESSAASSSSVAVVTGLGSCKPAKSPIDKGESVAWTFTPNPTKTVSYGAMAFAQAQYAWDFGGLTDDGSGVTSTSGKVTYASSGKFGASVTVSVKNKDGALETETKECEPLQVNGDPITGCKCSATAGGAEVTGSVNMQVTPDVVWTVTGCTSAAEINSWEWDGTAGTESFTKNFTAETASYAPTLKVGNNDNTVQEVTCAPVKVTDGAEYTVKVSGADGKIKLPAGTSSVVLEVSAFGNKVICQIDRTDSPSGAVNGSVAKKGDVGSKVAIKGQDYVAVVMASGILVKGAELDFVLDVPASCGVE